MQKYGNLRKKANVFPFICKIMSNFARVKDIVQFYKYVVWH